MKLSDWAKQQGVSYKTAWRLSKSGKFPLPVEQLPTGTIIVHEKKPPVCDGIVLYARVSSHNQKADLKRQLQRLRDYAAAHGLRIRKEIGFELNGRRKQLLRVLQDESVPRLLVEHRDRLIRFGIEYIQAALRAGGRDILVLNDEECKDDLVPDIIEVLTSFCVRLYGRRSARSRAKKAMKAVQMG